MFKKVTTRVATFAVLASLVACTSYQPEGFTGGFTETPLAKNAYQISSGGNAFTSAGKVRNIALVRAAELTLEKGFVSFIILDQDDEVTTSTLSSPGTFNATTNYNGNSAYTSGTYSGPQSSQINKAQTTMVVRMYEEDEPGSENALNPMEIIETIGPSVNYKGPYLAESLD
jgi:hypothetical protein